MNIEMQGIQKFMYKCYINCMILKCDHGLIKMFV